MIDVKILREEPERVKKAVKHKNGDPEIVDQFLALDGEWRKASQELEALRAAQKGLSKERDVEGGKANKEKIKAKEDEVAALEAERTLVWERIPNLPSEDTPVGKDETANKVLRKRGEPTKFDFKTKDHVALGEALGLIDIGTAGKVSGTRFAYLKGDLVKLEFGLVEYALGILTDPKVVESLAKGAQAASGDKTFTPVVPPVLIRPEVFRKMARLEPKDDRYYIPSDDLYLIGSAEHALGPLHMDETVPEGRLPLRYVGFSTSFRREAGSYGKDTRGILRVHQFDKVEMESFTVPEHSLAEQEFFVAIQEYLMWSLELPYRVVICSTGDQGDADARHIDIETWMPGEGKYRETHSADLMNDYQARRLGARVKRTNGEIQFMHMNDATVFAIGRTLVAIMENYQTKEGKIGVPKVLQKYVGKEIIA